MSLILSTSFLTLCVLVGLLLPSRLKLGPTPTQRLLLFGTGSVLGLAVFELIPETYEAGGKFALVLLGLSWAAYSIAHQLHIGHSHGGHHHEHGREPAHDEGHAHGVGDGDGSLAGDDCAEADHAHHGASFALGAMIVHSFSDGAALGSSADLSSGLANAVLATLLVHKTYEAFTVGVLMLPDQALHAVPSHRLGLGLYVVSFPAGVGLIAFLSHSMAGRWNPETAALAAAVLTSVALGSLLGCVLHDFLIPAFRRLRGEPQESGWFFAGLALTMAVVLLLE